MGSHALPEEVEHWDLGLGIGARCCRKISSARFQSSWFSPGQRQFQELNAFMVTGWILLKTVNVLIYAVPLTKKKGL